MGKHVAQTEQAADVREIRPYGGDDTLGVSWDEDSDEVVFQVVPGSVYAIHYSEDEGGGVAPWQFLDVHMHPSDLVRFRDELSALIETVERDRGGLDHY